MSMALLMERHFPIVYSPYGYGCTGGAGGIGSSVSGATGVGTIGGDGGLGGTGRCCGHWRSRWNGLRSAHSLWYGSLNYPLII